jgi:phosphatidylglycerol lysyltransferase
MAQPVIAEPSMPAAVSSLERARELVMRHGWNATAYQIINPGIELWFSAGGEGVVGYVSSHGVRVVAGAPVCPEAALRAVAAEFERDADEAGQTVCYFGAEARLESIYRDARSHSMVLLGAQPAWDPACWPGIVAARASLRAQLNRARNKGVVVGEWRPERARTEPGLRRVLGEWLGSRSLPPLHFLVEPDTLERLFDRRIFVAERGGDVVGFVLASPVPARNGWLIEQFVRGRAAPNGTAELMIHTAVLAMARDGCGYVTLGLAPLSQRCNERMNRNPLWLRALLGWLRAHGRRFYNFDGLDVFKAKFQPQRWEPVYAVSNRPRFTPATLYAVAAAFSRTSPAGLIARALVRAARAELARMRRGEDSPASSGNRPR